MPPHHIQWNLTVRANYTDAEGYTRTYVLDYRKLSEMLPHETTPSARIRKMKAAIKLGVPLPLISLANDGGMILDGHCRYAVALSILGADALVPVELFALVPPTTI